MIRTVAGSFTFRLAGLVIYAGILLAMAGCAAGTPIGQITQVQGLVEHRQPKEKAFSRATGTTDVFGGSALRTGEDGNATVNLPGIGDMEFRNDSFFEFSADPSQMRLQSGFGRFQIKSQKNPFSVNTPHGVTAVHGTTFMLRIEPDLTMLVVEEGTVSFTCRETGKTQTLGPGKRLFANDRGFPKEVEDLPLKELQELGRPGGKIRRNQR